MFGAMATLTSRTFALSSGRSLDLIGRSRHSKDSDFCRDQLNRTIKFSELNIIPTRRIYSILPTLRIWNISTTSWKAKVFTNTSTSKVRSQEPSETRSRQKLEERSRTAEKIAR